MASMELRILSFNISGDNRSALSPDRFTLIDKYKRIAELAIAADPHLISLQEVFHHTDVLGEALLTAGFVPCGQVESHCGFTQLWVRSSLQPEELRLRVGPVAVCRIPLPLGGGEGAAAAAAEQGSEAAADEPGGAQGWLYFAGCHLEPFAEGASLRLRQVERLVRALPPRSRLILAGDCNMRYAENSSVEELGLADAFRQAGSPQEANYTWNTKVNLYYGPDTRQYNARYDRIYLRGLQATQLSLFADKPIHPRDGDYLSDHFGLLGTVKLLADTPPSPNLPRQGSPSERWSSAAGRKRPAPGGHAEAAEGQGAAGSGAAPEEGAARSAVRQHLDFTGIPL